MTFEDWDENGNGLISRSEFVEVFKIHFVDDWDVADDGYFDDEDIFKGSFRMWDEDDDKLISEDEWMQAYEYYYGDYVVDEYAVLDSDGDGYLEYTEFHDALVGTDFITVWDVSKDKMYNEYELARMIFNNWDHDDTNFIEKDEYEDFDNFYLDI
jgi:hypothetical protein